MLHGCHIRVIETLNLMNSHLTVNPIHPVILAKYRVSLMAGNGHDDRIRHPRLPEVRDGAMAEIMKLEILNPSQAARFRKGGFYRPNAISPESKHIGTTYKS